MQSEDFDNKLRQAADQHHPDYAEQAWPKMEKLLDKHLPQKKDGKKRIIFILFLFLFLAGGTLVFINQPWKGKRNTVQAKQTIQKSVMTGIDETIVTEKQKNVRDEASDVNTSKNNIDDENNNSVPVSAQVAKNQDKGRVDIKAGKRESQAGISVSSVTNKKRNKQKPDQLVNDQASKQKPDNYLTNDQQDKNIVEPSKQSAGKVSDDGNTFMKKNEPESNDHSQTTMKQDQNIAGSQSVSEKMNDIHTDQNNVAKKEKNKSKKGNSFFISLSAGPDISAVGKSGLGKIKLLTGVGFGYTFKDRWTIRTGFYTGNKVYTTTPGNYKPVVPVQNPNYLYEIAADCKVYEIPLSLSYNFNPSKTNSLFAAAGLSSFIMKKEAYDYQYKYPNGQAWTYTHTEENRNKHYFSVLALSGGYERRINKNFSLIAEPYIKIPLAGIGYGKVRLISTGIAVSVNIKPFQ